MAKKQSFAISRIDASHVSKGLPSPIQFQTNLLSRHFAQTPSEFSKTQVSMISLRLWSSTINVLNEAGNRISENHYGDEILTIL
jgi:hypothetical protein